MAVSAKGKAKAVPALQFQNEMRQQMSDLKEMVERLAKAAGGPPPGANAAASVPPPLFGAGGLGQGNAAALAEARRLAAGASASGMGSVPPGLASAPRPPPPRTPKASGAAPATSGSPDIAQVLQDLTQALLSASRQDVAADFGVDMPAASLDEVHGVGSSGQSLSGQASIQRVIRTRRDQPQTLIQAHEFLVKNKMGVLPGESWNWMKFFKEEILKQCGNFVTLKRIGAILAAALDEGRSGNALRQHAFLIQALSIVEEAAKDQKSHDLGWSWPLLGIPDPGAAEPTASFAPVETSAVSKFHREQHALRQAKKGLGNEGSGGGGGSSSDGSKASIDPGVLKQMVKAELAAQNKGKGGAPSEDVRPKKGDGKGDAK